MSLKFDATLKDLVQVRPQGFLATFDVPPAGPVAVLNVDLSTVTTGADAVLGLGDPLEEIVHIDFQASASATKHADILAYNALLYRQYLAPVHSIVLLLRPQAAHSNLDGTVAYAPRPQRGRMDYRYEVIALWQVRAEQLLLGDLGTVPLATLCKLPVDSEAGLAQVVQNVVERLLAEAPSDQARRLLTAAFVLTGLRVPREKARQLFRGVEAMHESDTYMAIIDEGREIEVKKIILWLGESRFGPISVDGRARLTGITDVERLEQMVRRLHELESWQELLDLS